MGKAVLLVQWLNSSETSKEVDLLPEELKQHPGVEIRTFDERDSCADVLSCIKKWLSSDSQFLYVGSHGVTDESGKLTGFGPNFSNFVCLRCFMNLLASKSVVTGLDIWLGACYSNQLIEAINPMLKDRGNTKLRDVVAFSGKINSLTCLETLSTLLHGILGVNTATLNVDGISISSQFIIPVPIEKSIPRLLEKGGEFNKLELYRPLNGSTLSRVPFSG